MDQSNLLCAIALLLASLVSFTGFVHARSPESSTANTPYLWLNNPTTRVNSTQDFETMLTPILLRASNGTNFACGFYCRDDQTCYFSVLVFQNKHYESNTSILDDSRLVWSANRDRPVKINATLELRLHEGLFLRDADGTEVWSAKTGNKTISGLNLTETGNLVLSDTSNAVVWQSFDHPTDTLLQGQILIPYQKLVSSKSASNLSQGLQSLAFQDNKLFAYTNAYPQQLYYVLNSSSDHPHPQLKNGSFYDIPIPPASAYQFIKFEPDGHLKVYEWSGADEFKWKMVADVLTHAISDCGYPTVCGKYGICSNGGLCSCPEGTSYFKQMDYKQPDLGCVAADPVSCNYGQYQSLVELKGMSYFEIEVLLSNVELLMHFEATHFNEKIDVNSCKQRCLEDCLCQAAIYLYGHSEPPLRGCCLVTEVFSLINKNRSYDEISVFIEVQKSQPPSPSPPPLPLPPIGPHRRNLRPNKVILGSGIAGLIGVIMAVSGCFLFYKRRGRSDEPGDFCFDQIAGMPTKFCYEDLKVITNNFSDKLGEGGFGSVFQGMLVNGTKVAVKRLNGSGHGEKSFIAEVQTIGSLHHVNLVRLIGFCAEKSQRLLVYEYMTNGSTDKWIFHRQQEHTLRWQSRRKIIADIAKGLAYLHEECSHTIYHLDIKPQNILLDDDFRAKVSDFGLAKLIDKGQSQVMTTLRGTPGYMAPEWLSSFITEKVDVYSFGVVVLEILCGRKNLDRSQPEEDMHLLSMFKRKEEEGKLYEMVDKYNEDMQSNSQEVIEMMKISVWCLQYDPSRRPSMSVVVKVLEGLVEVNDNLDYDIANVAIPRAIAAQDHHEGVIDAATQLLPSTLSGPR